MDKSKKLFSEAQELIPGGVNSPVRAFRAVGGTPPFIKKGRGSHIWDEDGNEYIDYVLSWGPLILGHSHPQVVEAIKNAAENGTTFGAPIEKEITISRLIREAFPSIELVRFVNSGTEAAMSALRVARGFTGRKKIIKMEGCYHGHSDSLLAKAGSGITTLGVPDSLGVLEEITRNTITIPFNDLESLVAVMKSEGKDVAAVILEPVAGNMGVIPPKKGYLEGVREITSRYKTLLIFDEVISGFRVAFGGAQELYGVKPDVTVLGKIIGGGLPVGAYGGRKDIMEIVAPIGGVYQAGTLSGNPIALTAGIETIRILQSPEIYGELETKASYLSEGIDKVLKAAHLPHTINRVGSMLTIFHQEGKVENFQDAKKSDTQSYAFFFRAMMEEGIYLAPSQFEATFISTAHSIKDIEATISKVEKVVKKISF